MSTWNRGTAGGQNNNQSLKTIPSLVTLNRFERIKLEAAPSLIAGLE